MSVGRHPGSILRTALAFFAAASWTTLAHAGTFSTLHAFGGADGISPMGVIGDAAGNLYGAAEYGGPPAGCTGCGDVYVLDPSGALAVLLDFPQGSTGIYPGNQLALAGTHLVGATTSGNNAAEAASGSVYTVLKAGGGVRSVPFDGTNGGNPAIATLRIDHNGNVFGATKYGGPGFVYGEENGDGTLFEVTPKGVLTVLHDFNGADGQEPDGLVLVGTTLFGTTLTGGACSRQNSCGTVFMLELANGNTLTTLYDFPIYSSPVIAGVDAAGNIYGVTRYAGDIGAGTIFELKLIGGSYQYELLHNFTRTAGSPYSAPLLTSAGHLVGVTPGGEVNGSDIGGVLYDYSIANDTLTPLYTFPPDIQPNSTPYIDEAGAIYGTTLYGGDFACASAGCGTVWKYTR